MSQTRPFGAIRQLRGATDNERMRVALRKLLIASTNIGHGCSGVCRFCEAREQAWAALREVGD